MKFSDGCWLNRKGIMTYGPAEVNRVMESEKEVKLIVPCKKIQHRGDTLQGPVLEYRFSSPMDDIIKIRITHFKGLIDRGPHFDLAQDKPRQLSVKEDGDTLTMGSGKLKVRINKQDWQMDFFRDDKYLTGSGSRDSAYILENETKPYIREKLKLSVGENIYGLGERFTAFVKNGQTVDIWNKDGGTGTEQSYKNIPFYLSNRGYGVFVNHTENVSYEIASEMVSRAQFSLSGEYLEYYIIGGESLKSVLTNYTALSGRSALPPAWSFGLWLTTSFTTNYDEKTVTSFIEGMRERDIPLDVFHFDCFWMKEFNWCDFEWDNRVFPEPEKMVRRLKGRGLHLSIWINPYVGQASPLFDEGAMGGYFIRKENGDVWQWDLWQPGMAIVDFTNPQACEWYKSKITPLLKMGIDSLKTDFGERIPVEGVVYHDDSDPQKMHNYYTYLYNKTVYEAVEEIHGENKAVLFARSATVGCQKFPIHWGGDSTSDYESMAESLRGGLSLGLCGFSFWSHDMGGFESTSSADVYKRWAAFGLLSSHSRLHGSSSYRVPWLYDKEAVDVVRYFARLKNALMPYIYSQAVDSAHLGLPLMRAMLLEFEDDPLAGSLDRQYMLGSSLLVAPIFNDENRGEFYLPAGTWTHLLSGEERMGGKFYKESYDYLSLPLFVRSGTILPFCEEAKGAEYDFTKNVVYRLWKPEEGEKREFTHYTADNSKVAHISMEGNDQKIKLTWDSQTRMKFTFENFTVMTDSPLVREGKYLEVDSLAGKMELNIQKQLPR
jgi:alpha-D-xyloside xylohydrolase